MELCKSCGLCCQGVFHTFAIFNNDHDRGIAQSIPATLVEDVGESGGFCLPCPAYNGQCGRYPDRPSVCGNHRCDLLAKLESGGISLEQAVAIVKEMQGILDGLLPTLQRIAGSSEYNKPEALMNQITSGRDAGKSEVQFNNENRELLLALGAFILLKNRRFYADEGQLS